MLKKCCDCKHNVSETLFGNTEKFCTVKGRLASSWKMRYKKTSCGIQGKLWEPREYVEEENKDATAM
jgi:hypothetical protein